MSGWWKVILALAAFLASHGVPAIPGLRAAPIAGLGRRCYIALCSLLSLLLLAWSILAVGRAPSVEPWPLQPWHHWVPFFAMPFVCLLAVLGLGVPLSLGGRAEGFDPERPGIAGIARHPLLWAFALWAFALWAFAPWAGAHALARGDLAHVALFSAFALFSLPGARAIDRRRQRQLGLKAWQAPAVDAPFFPFGRLGRTRLAGWASVSLVLRLRLALLLFPGLVALHPPVIGASPLPPGLGHG